MSRPGVAAQITIRIDIHLPNAEVRPVTSVKLHGAAHPHQEFVGDKQKISHIVKAERVDPLPNSEMAKLLFVCVHECACVLDCACTVRMCMNVSVYDEYVWLKPCYDSVEKKLTWCRCFER